MTTTVMTDPESTTALDASSGVTNVKPSSLNASILVKSTGVHAVAHLSSDDALPSKAMNQSIDNAAGAMNRHPAVHKSCYSPNSTPSSNFSRGDRNHAQARSEPSKRQGTSKSSQVSSSIQHTHRSSQQNQSNPPVISNHVHLGYDSDPVAQSESLAPSFANSTSSRSKVEETKLLSNSSSVSRATASISSLVVEHSSSSLLEEENEEKPSTVDSEPISTATALPAAIGYHPYGTTIAMTGFPHAAHFFVPGLDANAMVALPRGGPAYATHPMLIPTTPSLPNSPLQGHLPGKSRLYLSNGGSSSYPSLQRHYPQQQPVTAASLNADGVRRRSGRVKFFNSQKGYGFIIPEDPKEININGRHEIFVHHTAIHNEGGFKSLAESEEVEYELVDGAKGLQAANVTGPSGAPVRGDPNGRLQSSHSFSNNRSNFSGASGPDGRGSRHSGRATPIDYPVDFQMSAPYSAYTMGYMPYYAGNMANSNLPSNAYYPGQFIPIPSGFVNVSETGIPSEDCVPSAALQPLDPSVYEQMGGLSLSGPVKVIPSHAVSSDQLVHTQEGAHEAKQSEHLHKESGH